MKIITWNCNMAFRKKAAAILALKPDILVLPECECLDNLKFNSDLPQPTDSLWYGSNKHKGLAILAYGDICLKPIEGHNPDFKTIVPIHVTGVDFNFNLFAVWANNPGDKDGQYVEQVWKAIHHYEALLTMQPTVFTGDFNSNTIWDRKRRAGNHTNVVKFLEEKGIHSTYHHFNKQLQGQEQHPTFYLYRHQNKPYHLDYCFLSDDLLARIIAVEVGEHAAWATLSDHVPLMITLK
jgi:exodeoxyribonuclease-3